MVKAPTGYRSKTRNLLRKHVREKGGVPRLSKALYPYQVGDKVTIKIDSSFHDGMPHRRFHGLTGTIVDKRGKAYVVKVNLGNKEKTLITYAVHLRPFKQNAKETDK
ncbi:MAG: 50S ribosomal protein L21e [Caldisphaera sp.]|nr:50S ribosomal protein L21e [Caldisphaera sp.]PMP60404.1 MAG: 50S ribosomal protein L21e [Caldisphaera sp.]PMP88247.1 MAG: 50S ribosomal protein L21e [Caldisphaera sp.]